MRVIPQIRSVAPRVSWTARLDDPRGMPHTHATVPARSAAEVPPPAAARWLAHAVRPGAEGFRHAELRMHGEILAGHWRAFGARQTIDAGRAFTWQAAAGRGPLAVRGWDRYTDGAGAMRWSVLGIPVVRASGPDVTRSAAGRLAGETVLCPSAAIHGVRWLDGDDDRAVFRIRVGAWDHDVTIHVDAAGGLLTVDLPRWGDPLGEGYGLHGFHVACEGGLSQMGVTVPRTMRAGWRAAGGGVREFFRATVTEAVFR